MSSLKSSSKTTESGTKTESGTTTPILPGNLQTGLTGLVDKTNALSGQDPYGLVAGASPLQMQAFNAAGNLNNGGQGINWGGGTTKTGQTYGNDSGYGGYGGYPSAPSVMAPAIGAGGTGQDTGGSSTGWQGGLQRSADLAGQVANTGPAYAGAYTYQAPEIGSPTMGPVAAANMPTLGGPQTYNAQGYQAQLLGNPQTYTAGQAQGSTIAPVGSYDVGSYQAPSVTAGQSTAAQGQASLGSASLGSAYDATASLAGAQQAGYQGYNATMNGPVGQAEAGQANSVDASTLLDKFRNPFEQQVTNATLANYDADAARARNELMAQGAAAHAFGGSRFGIAQGTFDADTGRNRALTEAQLHSQGFNTALGAAQNQAALDTGVNVSNAGNRTQTSIFNTGQGNENNWRNTDALNHAAEFYAGAGNQAQLTNASLGTQAAMGNADRLTQVSDANANRHTTTSNNNASLLTNMANSNADRLTSTSNSNAGYQTQSNISNAGNQTQANIAGANLQGDAFKAYQDAINNRNQNVFTANNNRATNQAQIDAETGRFNTGQYNDAASRNTASANDFAGRNQNAQMQQLQDYFAALNHSNEANANSANQFALNQYGEQSQSARQFAGDTNQANNTRYTTDSQRMTDQARLGADASQFGARALNDQSQFNANQYDDQLQRQIQAAQLYEQMSNDYGVNSRGDAALQGDLGAQQRDIQQQYLNAPYNQLAMLGQAYGYGSPMIGSATTGNSAYQGTSVTKTKPSIFEMLMQAGQTAGRAAAGGAGG
jgi:hypothetical protein